MSVLRLSVGEVSFRHRSYVAGHGSGIRVVTACVSYLTGKDDFPPPPCCAGVSELKESAVSIADKKAACECVKAAAARIPDLKDEAASSLPAKCKVQVDFPISKNFNCADIH